MILVVLGAQEIALVTLHGSEVTDARMLPLCFLRSSRSCRRLCSRR